MEDDDRILLRPFDDELLKQQMEYVEFQIKQREELTLAIIKPLVGKDCDALVEAVDNSEPDKIRSILKAHGLSLTCEPTSSFASIKDRWLSRYVVCQHGKEVGRA